MGGRLGTAGLDTCPKDFEPEHSLSVPGDGDTLTHLFPETTEVHSVGKGSVYSDRQEPPGVSWRGVSRLPHPPQAPWLRGSGEVAVDARGVQ